MGKIEKRAIPWLSAGAGIILAVLLVRGWTDFYFGSGQAERDASAIYQSNLEDGRGEFASELDASNDSFVIWWGVTCLILVWVPAISYRLAKSRLQVATTP